MSKKKTNYASMAGRIRKCKTLDALTNIGKSLERLYLAGIFTVSEFQRLNIMIIDQIIKIEE